MNYRKSELKKENIVFSYYAKFNSKSPESLKSLEPYNIKKRKTLKNFKKLIQTQTSNETSIKTPIKTLKNNMDNLNNLNTFNNSTELLPPAL